MSDLTERLRMMRNKVERLTNEAELFQMAYRMKCDEETKVQAVEIERLTEQRDELLAALVAVETLFAPVATDCTQKVWLDKAREAIAKAESNARPV